MTTIHKTTALDITFCMARSTGKLHINTPLNQTTGIDFTLCGLHRASLQQVGGLAEQIHEEDFCRNCVNTLKRRGWYARRPVVTLGECELPALEDEPEPVGVQQAYAEALSAYMETARQMDAFAATVTLDEDDEEGLQRFLDQIDELDARIGHEANARRMRDAKSRLLAWGRDVAIRQARGANKHLVMNLFNSLTRPTVEARVIDLVLRLDPKA